MQKIIRVAAIAAAFVAAGAQAQVYVEGSYLPTKISGDHGMNSDPKPSAFMGIVGYDLHPNLAIEGAIGLGLGSGSSSVTDIDTNTTYNIKTKIKSSYGVYLKPRYQISDELEVFARVGYLKSKFENSISLGNISASESISEGSTAWALGGNYKLNSNLYLTAAYNQLHSKDGVKVKGLNFGVGSKF